MAHTKQPSVRKFKGFTLIELIVVITILAILGTIGFLSIGGYSSKARDSARVGDSAQIAKSLDLSIITTGSYPTPDNSFSVTYSGGIVWNQGTVGSTVLQALRTSISGGGLNKKPTDPLDNSEYTYSSLAFGKAYQIQTKYEGDIDSTALSIPSFTSEALAAPGNPTISYIRGNYGWLMARTVTGGITYVLAVPSIITNSGSTGNLVSINAGSLSGSLLFHGRALRNASSFNPNLTPVYISTGGLPTTTADITTLMNSLRTTYSGSTADVRSMSSIASLMSITSTGTLVTLGSTVISGQLGGSPMVISGGEGGGSPADTTPPTGGNFTIPTTTTVTNITATITCPTDTTSTWSQIQMFISWTGLGSGGNVWESCTSSKGITTTSWDGSKNITMKWRDAAGNETNIVNRNINLSSYSTLVANYAYVSNSSQTFVVPNWVNSIKVKMWWAGGGAGWWSGDQWQWWAGWYVESILSVTPWETLNIYVGQAGWQAWCASSWPDAWWWFAMWWTGRQDHGWAGWWSTEIHRLSTRLAVAWWGGWAGSNYKSWAGCSGIQRSDNSINWRTANDSWYSSHHAWAGWGWLVWWERMSTSVHNWAYGWSCLWDYVCGNLLTMTPCNSWESNWYWKWGYNDQNYSCAASGNWATNGHIRIFQ